MSNFIRYATVEDTDSLAKVYSNSFKKAFEGVIPNSILEEKFSFESIQKSMHKELEEGLPKNIIMFKDEKPIGLLTFAKSKYEQLDDSCTEIWRIYLDPNYWDKNIGSELMNWGLKEIKENGYEKVILWVIEDNLRARKFYEKMGFKYDGTNRIINVGREIKDLRYFKSL
jgi:RimJ/RimL family protein N-acetyltransferase